MEKTYTEESAPSLKEAKHAVWLCRWLGFDLDPKFHCVVAGNLCFTGFLEKYITNNLLTRDAEVLLVENYHSKCPRIVVRYILLHGGSEEMIAKIIALNDANLFSVYCQKRRQSGKHLPVAVEQLIISSKNDEMLNLFFEYLSPGTFASLLQNDQTDVLEKYFKKNALSDSFQEELVKNGSQKTIALYIANHPLGREAQMKLVKKDYRNLLKMHFLKYGVDDFVVTYYAALCSFKQYIGVV